MVSNGNSNTRPPAPQVPERRVFQFKEEVRRGSRSGAGPYCTKIAEPGLRTNAVIKVSGACTLSLAEHRRCGRRGLRSQAYIASPRLPTIGGAPKHVGLASPHAHSGHTEPGIGCIYLPAISFEATIAAPRHSKAPLYLSEPSATKLSQKLLQQLVY